MVNRLSTALLLFVTALVGCSGPAGPECSADSDCAPGEACLSSGGVLFGSSYCVPTGATPAPNDAGVDAGAPPDTGDGCFPETACDGRDDDSDGVVDQGCPCNFANTSDGVCGGSVIGCDGVCEQPANFEVDESTCDGLDNDCDGETDEGQSFQASAVSAGLEHTCAITVDGEAFCFGRNSDGQLGDGTFDDSLTPSPVALGLPLTQVSAGGYHTCGIAAESAALYCWGRNDSGQVLPGADAVVDQPLRIDVTGVGGWSDVAAGLDFTCALGAGAVYCWGANDRLQLGVEESVNEPFAPIEQLQMFEIVSVEAGEEHACALTEDGTLLCWGSTLDGRLGRSTPDGVDADIPAPADQPVDFEIRDAALGGNHSCIFGAQIGADGNEIEVVACVGGNESQQLGRETPASTAMAQIVSSPATGPVAAGNGFSCSRSVDTVACWGTNASGAADPASPVGGSVPPTTVLGGGMQMVQIEDLSAGGGHACAVTSEGLKCWGDNTFGQLGAPADPGGIASAACAPRPPAN